MRLQALFARILITLTLAGCASHAPEPAPAITVPGIEPGMTREEVTRVLGDNFESYSALSRPPYVDSFPYEEDGEVKYVHVKYHRSGVIQATSGHTNQYTVY